MIVNALVCFCVLIAGLLTETPPERREAPATAFTLQDDVMDITLEELRDFTYRRGRDLPARIQALDGRRVRVFARGGQAVPAPTDA